VTVLVSASIAIVTLGWVASSHDAARGTAANPVLATPAASVVAVPVAPQAPAPVAHHVRAHHSSPMRSSVAPAAPVAATVSDVWTPLPSLANPAPGEAGMRAFLDPETGTIGGPVQLNDGFDAQASESWRDELVETRAADGSPMIDLKGHGQEYMMLHISLDGRRSVKCVEDPKKAAQSFADPSAAPVKE
jgi:hypothetical protein